MEAVVILNPGTRTDGYGDEVADWSDPTRTEAEAICWPATSSENNDGRSALISGLNVLFPDPCPPEMTHTSRIEARGATWEVAGDLGDWRSPWGWQPGHQVTLRRVEG